MAPVIKRLESCSSFTSEVCVTAQHRQMLDQVLDLFEIKPNYDLDIMQDDQDLMIITTKVLTLLPPVIEKSKPSLILVQGDTTTTFAASLAAFYLKVPVAHVEAGLRTYDKYSPFPEEINRRMVSAIADFNFAPTKWAKNNLLRENIPKEKVFVTGNTVVDALYDVLDIIESRRINRRFERKFEFLRKNRKIVLITGHRRESFGEGFKNVCNAIKRLAEIFSEYDFVYPVHLNPNVQEPVQNILNQDKLPNVYLIEPMEYLSFVYLMKSAHLILTDSGGIQEEALTFGKPVLVMRSATERPEGMKAGAVKLVGSNKEAIFNECKAILLDPKRYNKMSKSRNPYGDGKAAERIVGILLEKL